MKLITFAGPPSSGKTSVILQLIKCLKAEERIACVVKFDCLTSFDHLRYKENGVPVQIGFSDKICPDHYFVTNIEDVHYWAKNKGYDYLITESAGLCSRCSPHITGVLGVCVIDTLSGVDTPRKVGPMLKEADLVVVTKGDIVSQAEREVFAFNVRQVNAKAKVMFVNGITGQGAFMLSKHIKDAAEHQTLLGNTLRFTTPSAVCSYCLGETRIDRIFEMNMSKRLEIKE